MSTSADSALNNLRATMSAYWPISDETWSMFADLCTYKLLPRQHALYRAGERPTSYAYVAEGLVRGFICDDKGHEYNKNFFSQGQFPGSMAALLTGSVSKFTFETLEDSEVVEIHFESYRRLLLDRDDLKLFQIHYLEKNWLLAKDAREVEIVQEDATQRYQRFLRDHPELSGRLAQHHVASHLGITPTQLSRIRRKLSPSQPM